jgi:hypothetical protein
MGDYFKPWRRKIGVVTLVMACVFTAAWVRSQTLRDRISLGKHSVQSYSGGVAWMQYTRFIQATLSIDTDLVEHYRNDEAKIDKQLRWWRCGFENYEQEYHIATMGTGVVLVWRVLYWPIVIPLTLLSAFLLLSKPRKSAPKKTTEAIPEKVE